MVDTDFISLCKRFCSIIAPSGYEDGLANEIVDILGNYGYTFKFDVCGNLICSMPKNTKMKKIAFIAHMDSAPIIINGIDDKKNVFWGSLSKWKTEKINNQSITFISGTTGVAHASEEGCGSNVITDIHGHIEVGDFGALTPFFRIEDDIITATFLDDRIGCAILVDVAKMLIHIPIELSFIFTVQEEIGNKGAQKIAQQFEFDEAYIIDTTRTHSKEYSEPVYAVMGKGMCIKICDGFGLCSVRLNKKVLQIAEEKNVPIQKEVIFRGGSDIGAFAKFGTNTHFTGLSIPCRNMHSRSEQVCLNDVIATRSIILEILKKEQCLFRE